MSAKEIVAKLRAMAADPSHRTQLVKEPGTIPTLISSLSESDTDISFTALEVVYFLSLNVDNRPIMAQETLLLKALKQFMMTGTLKQKKVAIAAYTNLQAYANSLPTGAPEPAEKENTDNAEATSSSAPSKQATGTAAAPRATSLLSEGTTINTYTVFVSGLNTDSAKRELEQALLKVRGVISIYCDTVEYKAVIRATIPVQDIIDRLHIDGKTASLRKKDVVSDDAAAKGGADDGYLDEVDSSSSPAHGAQGSSWFGFGSLVTFGSETPEDRKERLERERKQNQGSWFGKIGKALYIM